MLYKLKLDFVDEQLEREKILYAITLGARLLLYKFTLYHFLSLVSTILFFVSRVIVSLLSHVISRRAAEYLRAPPPPVCII
jgi:hypothetical protein